MNPDDIKDILHKPLIEKLKDMQQGLQLNIAIIYESSTVCGDCENEKEYARANDQIWGLQFAKGMLDSILRLEERRELWDKEKESVTSE